MQLEPRNIRRCTPASVRAVDEVVGDRQVLVQELRAVGVVGVDAADLGRRDEDVGGLRALRGRRAWLAASCRSSSARSGASTLRVAGRRQAPHQRRADHAAGAGDQDRLVLARHARRPLTHGG